MHRIYSVLLWIAVIVENSLMNCELRIINKTFVNPDALPLQIVIN